MLCVRACADPLGSVFQSVDSRSVLRVHTGRAGWGCACTPDEPAGAARVSLRLCKSDWAGMAGRLRVGCGVCWAHIELGRYAGGHLRVRCGVYWARAVLSAACIGLLVTCMCCLSWRLAHCCPEGHGGRVWMEGRVWM